MPNKRNKKIQQSNFYKSPIFVVLILSILMAAFFIISREASAQLNNSVRGGFNYVQSTGLGTTDLRTVVFTIVNVLLGFLSMIAVLLIMYAGFLWMTSQGDPRKVEDAKKILRNAAIGLVIIFLSFSIAYFIFQVLLGGTSGGGGIAGPGGPPGPCTNCSALGGGIIESVYPAPGATNVPRNTLIFVTFKELMKDDTICMIAGCNSDMNNNIEISYIDPNDSSRKTLPNTDVHVDVAGQRTYVFRPKKILGDGVHNIWYTVNLGNDIFKADGTTRAFPFSPYFWRFEVGTRLDLVPPVVNNVFPIPDTSNDTYNTGVAANSVGTITVTSKPTIARAASVSITVASAIQAPRMTFVGSYAGIYDGTLRLRVENAAAGTPLANLCGGAGINLLTAGWAPVRTGTPVGYCLNSSKTNAVLEDGIALSFNPALGAGDQGQVIELRFIGFKNADTLQVSNTLYTFVDNVPTSNTEIQTDNDLNSVASRIGAKINLIIHNPGVTSPSVNLKVVNLKATLAGIAGDSIPLIQTGGWAAISGMGGGQNADLTITVQDKPDQPRNAIIKMDFNEAMMPNTIGGKVVLNGGVNGVGALDATSFNIIGVQADMGSPPDGFQNDEFIEGDFVVSSLYGTAEFVPKTLCGKCSDNGASCTDAATDCNAGQTCDPIRNSCGEFVHCLPVKGKVTHYRVVAKAATLIACAGDPDCKDSNYKLCAGGPPGVCNSGAPTNINYPQSNALDGAQDASANSLDGDKDANAEGSSVPGYDFGKKVNNGDTMFWDFYINSTVRLTPPHINNISTSEIPPGEPAANLTARPQAEFDSLLMSSSLKPGSGYRDGMCIGCTIGGNDCPGANQKCVAVGGINQCQSSTFENEFFCTNDTDCRAKAGGLSCINKHYVTLFDKGCVKNGSLYYTGWWISGEGRDVVAPPDGFNDVTAAIINHTPFCEVTRYGSEMGSGIKDVYQNCYLPSGSIGGGSCAATQASPYCCNGAATNLKYCCAGGPSPNPC